MDIKNIEQCLSLNEESCSEKEYCLFSSEEGYVKCLFPKII